MSKNDTIFQLDKTIHSQVRLSIMTILATNNEVPFNYLKKTLSITDGNLNTHLKVLEKSKYILVKKGFVDNKPQTKYSLTQKGIDKFIQYINTMDKMLKKAGGHLL